MNDYGLKIRSCEEIWVKISLNSSDKIFGIIYRHPVQCLTDFQSSFEPTVEKLINQKLEYYICGDITIDLLQYDSNVHVKNYSDMLFSLGCIPLIKPPTRITSSSATLIDHIYSNNISSQTTTHILLDDISDHLPAILLLNNTKHNKAPTRKLKKDESNFNQESFILDLHKQFSLFKCNKFDVDGSFKRLIEILNSILDKHALLRTKSTRQQKLSAKP